jgi:hypothetical protein
VLLGEEKFVASNLERNEIENKFAEIADGKTRRFDKPVPDWAASSGSRDDAISGAYGSGASRCGRLATFSGCTIRE